MYRLLLVLIHMEKMHSMIYFHQILHMMKVSFSFSLIVESTGLAIQLYSILMNYYNSLPTSIRIGSSHDRYKLKSMSYCEIIIASELFNERSELFNISGFPNLNTFTVEGYSFNANTIQLFSSILFE